MPNQSSMQDSNGTISLAENTPAVMLNRLREAEQAIRACMSTYDPNGQPHEAASTGQLELSVVMPCLNEADTLASCIDKAKQTMLEHGIHGEVIVADNGSTDESVQCAEESGARVVHVAENGYGNALQLGIEAAHGRYVIMGDPDGSYDFREIPKFLDKLRDGHELVQGCRLPSGGGTLRRGAMPIFHRWLVNPMFSWMARRMFGAPIRDLYCGFRGFTRQLCDKLELRGSGVEFATEMIIKSSLFEVDIAEVPITSYPHGRRTPAPHLRTSRDGWRTLPFSLMYRPKWLFLVPGLVLFFVGLLGYAFAFPGVQALSAALYAQTLLAASLAILIGTQAVQFALLIKTFAVAESLVPADARLEGAMRVLTLERCLLTGSAMFVTGCGLVVATTSEWLTVRSGPLDFETTMRWMIPGGTLAAIGLQTMFASCFMSILGMRRK